MYVLIKADSTTHLDCELLGSYSTKHAARIAMRAKWNEGIRLQLFEGFIEESDIDYGCFIEGDFAQIAPAHGTNAIHFYIFDTNNKED